jgi:hypothetical protein
VGPGSSVAVATSGSIRALALLGRSKDHFTRADLAKAPARALFFTETDMSAIVGTVYTELALTMDPTHTRSAIPALSAAINGYGPGGAGVERGDSADPEHIPALLRILDGVGTVGHLLRRYGRCRLSRRSPPSASRG